MSDNSYTLGGMYGFQTLSRVLEDDALEASKLGMNDVENKLSDLARHAGELEERLERKLNEKAGLEEQLARLVEDGCHAKAEYRKIHGQMMELEQENEDLKAKVDVLEKSLSQSPEIDMRVNERISDILEHKDATIKELQEKMAHHVVVKQQLWEALENFVSSSDIQRQSALSVMDGIEQAEDLSARAQVESELYQAGIIEDPDMDGGLLG